MSVDRFRQLTTVLLVAFLIYFGIELLAGGNKSFGDFISTVWGRVVLVDLVLGLAIFGAWVVYRESSALVAGAWIASFCLLGNAGTLLYILVHLRNVRRSADIRKFLLGRHATP